MTRPVLLAATYPWRSSSHEATAAPAPNSPAAAATTNFLRGFRKEVALGGLSVIGAFDKKRVREERNRPKHCGHVHKRPGVRSVAGLSRVLISS